MRFSNPLIVTCEMARSVQFYHEVLGLDVIVDFGANKTLTGGVCLQTRETFAAFINTDDIRFGANNAELYFEEDDFDAFLSHLTQLDIQYVHPVKEHAWGQRVVRFYDPDRHIIEVGENMRMVCLRFSKQGMTPEQVAKRMDVPLDYVKSCLNCV